MLREPHKGAKALEHCCPETKPRGQGTDGSAACCPGGVPHCRAGGRARSGRSLQPRDPSSPRQHAEDPDTGIHWKHVLESNLHLSSWACGLASACPALLPPPTPSARQYLNLCVQPRILHPQLSSRSALEVNIVKYILILKYSVSILQCVSKVRLSHGKRSLN